MAPAMAAAAAPPIAPRVSRLPPAAKYVTRPVIPMTPADPISGVTKMPSTKGAMMIAKGTKPVVIPLTAVARWCIHEAR